MTVLVANPSGQVAGRFDIPAGVPAGTKRVTFTGDGGSRGEASFIGSNTLVSQVQRQVMVLSVDPLAQTFTLESSGLISGIDLWFTALGASDVIVQIRDTIAGVPGQSILAQSRVAPATLSTNGHSRITFPAPTRLESGPEYAIVVMCDDALTALAIAELGKWDAANARWVTAQPYQVGVLLSSSNASTWTPHQDRDMTFRLLAPQFTETVRTVNLGNVEVVDASDLMVLADVERLGADADVRFRLTLVNEVGTPSVELAPWQGTQLAKRYTGPVKMEAVLTGTATVSPILFPDIQLAVGDVSEMAQSVSRQFDTGGGTNATVTFETLTPGASGVAVELHNGTSWAAVPLDSSKPSGDGWVERTHKLTGFAGEHARVRLSLTGSLSARPRARALRVAFT